MLAVFVQVTVVPTFTVSEAGEKAKLTIETAEPPPCWLPVVAVAAGAAGVLVAAAGAVVGVGDAALVVPPQPASAVASASAQMPTIVAARQERGRLFTS